MLLVPLISYILIAFYKRKYLKIMKFKKKNDIDHYDLYIENMMELFKNSKKNREDKFFLLFILRNHINSCCDLKCFCYKLVLDIASIHKKRKKTDDPKDPRKKIYLN